MGTVAELGLESKRANAVQRAMQAVASSRSGAWLFSRTLHHVDRMLHRVSKGRLTVPELVAGLPVIMVTTTGRRSGEPRTSPLLGLPLGGDVAIIGTNFGQAPTPGWVLNLEADARCRVARRGTEIAAVARLATEAESAEAFRLGSQVYAGYAKYQQRISGRDVRVFVLESVDPQGAPGSSSATAGP